MTTQQNVRGRRGTLTVSVRYGLMTLLGTVFFAPIVFMLVSSLKPELQLLRDSGSLRAFLPVGDISFQNYSTAFERAPVVLFISNSVLVTVITVILGLFVNSLAAFSLAHLRWKGREIVLSVIIATFIVPFETIAIPLLLVASRLPWIGTEGFSQGWLNTHHVQIIPFIVDAFSIFLFVQFFKSLPGELIEAARIDGAGWFQIYSRVFVPISGSVFSTAAILRGLYMWNQYLWPIMVVQEEKYRPVMVGVQYFFLRDIAWGQVMAYLSTITVPILVLFLALQQAFVESIASSGIKG